MRLFIEEAAGTTRFRARKIAAERKMERTRDNLLRVQDVCASSSGRWRSLQRQAKRAEEYHRLKDEPARRSTCGVMAARRAPGPGRSASTATELTRLHDEEGRCRRS